MMHIWGRLSRVVMACALSVLFLGGTGKTIWAAPAISFTDIAGREVQLDKDVRRRKLHRQFFDGRRSGESG